MSTLLAKLVLGGVLLTTGTAVADPMFGVATDVGVPDGAMASVVVRPTSLVKVHAGVGYNMISTGYRAGVTVTPLPWWFTPTVSVSYGKYPEGDANPLARMISGDTSIDNATLKKVGYEFADGYLGLQFGRRRASFTLEAGYSRVTGSVHGLDAMTQPDPDAQSSVAITQNPNLTVWSLSARVGLTIYVM